MQKALEFATRKHEGQYRSGLDEHGQKIPYVVHPQRVCQTLQNLGITDTNTLIAALLHDTVEDTETTLEEVEKEFNSEVMNLVKEVTNDSTNMMQLGVEQHQNYLKGEQCATSALIQELTKCLSADQLSTKQLQKRIGKAAYLSHKLDKLSKNALYIKLSDRLDNVSDFKLDTEAEAIFSKQYALETEFLINNLRNPNKDSVHETLLSLIFEKIQPVLQIIRSK